MNCVSSCTKLGLRNRIMNEVYDNEDMRGMEKQNYRRKSSRQINESDVEFDCKTMQISEDLWIIYPHVDIRYFPARGGIEPRGRCFMHHHTSRAFLTFKDSHESPRIAIAVSRSVHYLSAQKLPKNMLCLSRCIRPFLGKISRCAAMLCLWARAKVWGWNAR